MARTRRLRAVKLTGRRLTIRLGKDEEELLGDAADIRRAIRKKLDDDAILWLFLACILKRDPTLSTLAGYVGKDITIDLEGSLSHADGILRVSP